MIFFEMLAGHLHLIDKLSTWRNLNYYTLLLQEHSRNIEKLDHSISGSKDQMFRLSVMRSNSSKFGPHLIKKALIRISKANFMYNEVVKKVINPFQFDPLKWHYWSTNIICRWEVCFLKGYIWKRQNLQNIYFS